ncbi:TSUP family transporter [Rodentibacter haemolyticus]|uniref:Probable membrane transporter protein n=1 Tax=Rodentibacter haemolyticus TaxID=2778911 RepID=A0ABX6UYL3_9PAST|nr:TSUP family transporter [Rodentibacter haemolyticus]QPB43212.1 TSUP family transporter [Rodentibacter haemolyticus]
MELGIDVLAILFVVAFVAAFIDAIAGGGGLITIPALLMTGIPPAAALGTNKLQAMGGAFSASMYFLRKRAVNLREFWFILICVFLGSATGTILIQLMEVSVFKKLLPWLILAIGLYFLFTPRLGESDRKQRLNYVVFGLIVSPFLGFYDGFFGPGTGSIMSLTCVVLLGFNLAKATAHAKVMNFTSNLASFLFFLAGGQILWTVGIVMLLGSILGANWGAKMVMTRGKALIRPMVVIMSFIMTAKMAYDQGWFNF